MNRKIKIIIADDHTLVRQSIALAIQSDSNLQVIAQAENGAVLLEKVKQQTPDVIILDLDMPVMSGWVALSHLKTDYPQCKLIILSMHLENIMIKDLVSKGARGFLPKNCDFQLLINSIYEVNDLGYFFNKKISNTLVQDLIAANEIIPFFQKVKLTTNELQTLLMICNDKLTKEIASELNISERTVDRYKTTLYKKTKAKTTAGLVLFALKNNLFSIPR